METQFIEDAEKYMVTILCGRSVGKTAITKQYIQDIWVGDSYIKQINVDEKQCTLEIIDIAGPEGLLLSLLSFCTRRIPSIKR